MGGRRACRRQAQHTGLDLARFPRGEAERAQVERPDAHADQPQCGKADGRGHAADLPVLPLADLQLQPRRRDRGTITDRRMARPQPPGLFDRTHTGRLRDEVAEVDTCAQPRQRGRIGNALDLREVSLFQLVARIGNARLQCTVVGQQQQTFTVRIETASGVHARHAHACGQRGARGVFRELAHGAVRLVQGDQGHGAQVCPSRAPRLADDEILLHNTKSVLCLI
ncbi:hypothetical protein D3C81_1223200 [compost metagenome]